MVGDVMQFVHGGFLFPEEVVKRDNGLYECAVGIALEANIADKCGHQTFCCSCRSPEHFHASLKFPAFLFAHRILA